MMSNSSHYSSEMLLKEPVLPTANNIHDNGNVNSNENTSEKHSLWLGNKGNKETYEGNNHNTISDNFINNPVGGINDTDDYNEENDSLKFSELERQLKNQNDDECCDNNTSVLNLSDGNCEVQNKNILNNRTTQNTLDDNSQCLQEANEIHVPTVYDYNSDEGLFEYEEGDSCSSSTDMSPQDEERMLDVSDSDDSCNNHRPHPLPRGIHNPNYPGFQHLAYTLQEYSEVSPIYFENGSILPSNYHKCEDSKDTTEFYHSQDQNKERYFNEERETNNNDSSFENACDSNDKLSCIQNNSNSRNNIHSEPIPITSPIDIRRNGAIAIPIAVRNQNSENIYINDIDGKNLNGNISAKTFSVNQRIPLSVVNNINDNIEREDSKESFPSKSNSVSDFQEDLIALQREIYESIQKPLADTLQNISEVVNNVINSIAEQHHDTDCVDWATALENTEAIKRSFSYTENLHTEEKASTNDVRIEPKVCTYHAYKVYDEKNKPDDQISCEIVDRSKNSPIAEIIKLNMDDAYMSNGKEELLKSDENGTIKEEERIKSVIEKPTPDKAENIQINGNNHSCQDLSLHDSNFNKTTKPTSPIETENCNAENRPAKKCSNKVSRHIRKINENQSKKITHHTKGSSTAVMVKENSTLIGESSVEFDVYNIETAMPVIDLDAIENHLRAAREEERRRRNDREEIRRRLALGAEVDDFYGSGDRPGRKPSLQARLQSGMNLQICFMNDTASDGESPTELDANEESSVEKKYLGSHVPDKDFYTANEIKIDVPETKTTNGNSKGNKSTGVLRPSSLALSDTARPAIINNLSTQADFFACQARLQTEARMALAQAKEMAHIQMEVDRQRLENSPITEMLRVSLEKAGIEFFGDRRRVSRQMLTDMNIAQLQVIVNELHTQIEFLNESLVKLLIARDELHMGQDSMLVDIEDLTRHLGAKELTFKGGELNDEFPTPAELKKTCNIQPRFSSFTSLLTK